MSLDERYMKRALSLAARGQGNTSPNPMVGCVLVRGGKIIAEGWHKRAGDDHAEIDALRKARNARGATAYVTLEPCNHQGRTGPCSKALVDAGVKRVVFAMRDPNPHVEGGGSRRLRAAGIAVEQHLLTDEAAHLNRAWIKWVKTGVPWVTLKAAISLDGKLGTRTGESKWITGPRARKEAHRLRATHDAILVGAGTVIADNPSLTVREVRGRDPRRVIVDRRLRISPRSKAVKGALVFTAQKRATFGGAELVNETSWPRILRELGTRDITSVLVEGGGSVHGALVREGLIDEVAIFVAPLLIGGDGVPLLAGAGFASMKDVLRLKNVRVRQLGDDVLVTGQHPASSRVRGR